MDERNIKFSPSTSFNILKSYELRIDEMTFNNGHISEGEKSQMGIDDYGVIIIRSSLRIKNMKIVSEYMNVHNNYVLSLLCIFIIRSQHTEI